MAIGKIILLVFVSALTLGLLTGWIESKLR